METHARWHHAVFNALTIGFVAHAEVGDTDADAVRRRSRSFQELLAGRPIESPWVKSQMRTTNDLTSRDDDLFRMMRGGNCCIGRDSISGWAGMTSPSRDGA